MRKIDRFSLISRISVYEQTEKQANLKLAALEKQIAGLRSQLSSTTKGAETINDALHRFFGKNDIRISVTSDEKFIIMRGDRHALNLSEGERTAIAFSYFITKLTENGNDLSNTIVYIDYPVSSLDAHHLLHINSFIKSIFYNFDPTNNPKHSYLAKQLFLSTHNYELFHLTWECGAGVGKNLSMTYMVERIDSDNLICSQLKECPESIKRYKSEYLFLYHQMANYLKIPSDDSQIIFNLGNMARRFIEGYLGFKFFEHSKIDLTLPRLIPDPVQCERARKFMHFYSHTLNRTGGMQLPDMSEARAILTVILQAVRDHDPIHYKSLEATL